MGAAFLPRQSTKQNFSTYFSSLPKFETTESIIKVEAFHTKERGRNNFLNYASQLQATFARSQITKVSK
jgi:hypothetical protein